MKQLQNLILRPQIPWLVLFVGLLLSLAFNSQSNVQPLHESLLGTAFIGFVLSFVAIPRKVLCILLGSLLVIMAAVGIVHFGLAGRVWSGNPQTAVRFAFSDRGELVNEISATEGPVWATRVWEVQESEPSVNSDAELQFSIRLSEGQVGMAWSGADETTQMDYIAVEGETFTNIKSSAVSESSLFTQYVHTGAPIADRHFVAILRSRNTDGFAHEAKCAFRLQEAEHPFRFTCADLPLLREFERAEVGWTAPSDALGEVLRVQLVVPPGVNLQTSKVDLSEFTAGEVQSLGPLHPNGVTIEMRTLYSDATHRVSVEPSDSWETVRIPMTLASGDILMARLQVQAGLKVQLRDVEVFGTPSPALTPQRDPNLTRASLWHVHPNLAGHSAVALAMLLVLLTRSRILALLVFAVAGIAAYSTESRAAIIILISTAILLIASTALQSWRTQRASRRIAIGLIMAAGITTAFAFLLTMGRLGNSLNSGTWNQDVNLRQQIWTAAFDEMIAHPLQPSPKSTFKEVWNSRVPDAEQEVNHAHNFWLELGWRHGILGLIAAVAFSVLLVARAYYLKGVWGVLLMGAILSLNVVDLSLPYAYVWMPLSLSLSQPENRLRFN